MAESCVSLAFLSCVLLILLVVSARTMKARNGAPIDCFTLGVIAHGSSGSKNTSEAKFGYRVNIVWTYIDTDEVFQIFRSIRSFDGRPDIDLIMLLDYDPAIIRTPQLLETKSKSLILWGDNTKTTKLKKDATEKKRRTNAEICGDDVDPSLDHGDPYCNTDLKSSNDTSPYESMTVTAPKAMVQMIKTLQWTSVFVIHENATAREARILVDNLSTQPIFLVIYNIDSTPDLDDILHHIYEQTVPGDQQLNFVVLCRFHCARKIFRTANQFDGLYPKRQTLLKQFSRWLVTVYGHSKGVSRALRACADDLDNVAIVAIPEFNGAGSSHLETVVLEILKELFIEQSRNDTGIPDVKGFVTNLLKQKALNTSSRCKGYNIDTLLWVQPSGRLFSSVGYVDVAGNVVLNSKLFPNTNFGYNKRRFTVATLEYDPFVRKSEYKNGTIKYEGSVIDLLKELARHLNFTYTIVEPADGMWGALVNPENHTFNGLIGQLQRLEVDIVAAPIGHNSRRAKVVDFSFPFYYEYTTVIAKKPDPQVVKWRTFVDLFTWEVLVAIGIALLIVTALIFLLEKYNPYYDIPAHGEERSRNGGLHYLHNSFWYMYGCLLCQGGVHLPDSTTGRTLVSCWWLMCIVVVGIYSGNLIAFLTVTKEKPPFNTLEEMVELKDYKWGIMGGTVWETVFMNSVIPDYKSIGEGLRRFNKTDKGVFNMNVSYHIQRVNKGNYAWIGDKTKIEIAMSRECDLIQIKEEFLPLKYAFGFQKNSPHTLILSHEIMKIGEGGLLQIWKRKWWPKTNFCTSDKLMSSKALSLLDVQSAFYICVIGVFVGFVAFVCEVILFRYRKRRTNKENKDKEIKEIATDSVPPQRQESDTSDNKT